MSLKRKLLILLLIAVALGLLYPGVTQPVLTLTGTVEKSKIAELGIEMIAGEGADAQTRQMLNAISSFLGFDRIEGHLVAYNNTRSVWGTVDELSRTGNLPVAFLIVFFSLVIPVFKLLLQTCSLFI
ncbi:MAG: paraquat-inducible protein A, partial [Gammaproteobacteria bacterium]